MPVGVPLSTLRRDLRAETGTSLNPLQGIANQQAMDILLERQQRELWDGYQWRHLAYYQEMPLSTGEWIYTWPSGFNFDSVNGVLFATSAVSRWKSLLYGIDAAMIPPGGIPPNGTPLYWDNNVIVTAGIVNTASSQLRLFPAPSSNAMLIRIVGQAPLAPLVADTDTCTLDSKLIILFTAAEVLANQKSEGAPMKLTKAQNYLRRLLDDQGAAKRQNPNMGGRYRYGNDPDKRRLVPYIDYIPG